MADFEWDEAKNHSNIRKHGIDFDIAKRVFGGVVVTEIDGRKDYGEVRYRGIGTVQGKAMVATYTERFGRTRIISARPASRKERRKYHERYDRPLTLKEIGEVKDEDIDFSDIPELDDDFWKNAEVVEPDRTEQVTLRVKRSVLDFFKAPGKGYQTRINRVLEAYVRARRGAPDLLPE